MTRWRAVPGDDRVLPFTLGVSWLVLPFLLVALVLLYLLPESTDRLFAWTIEPPLTAMFLGSAYMGGIWFFTQVVRLRRWHRVQYGFPAVVLFAMLLGAATLLHWDRFHHGHVSFVAWAVLYVTTPFLALVALLLNRSADPGVPEQLDVRVPRPVRLVLGIGGGVALLAGLVLFAVPSVGIELWAWELTPLTARVVGAVLTLPGAVDLWLLVDDRWTSFRWMFQAQLASLALINAAWIVERDDLLWDRPLAWLFAGGVAGALVVYAALYLWGERALRVRPG
ncbi:hypothetical protein BJF88_12505 [Cellulosimicrobium sp. CUA-896]|nr:hypothetical protein BJF88_12505 [Cellulosimicrobium sp. CUA-896]